MHSCSVFVALRAGINHQVCYALSRKIFQDGQSIPVSTGTGFQSRQIIFSVSSTLLPVLDLVHKLAKGPPSVVEVILMISLHMIDGAVQSMLMPFRHLTKTGHIFLLKTFQNGVVIVQNLSCGFNIGQR